MQRNEKQILTQVIALLQNSVDINSAEFAQPICTAVQIALVNLLRKWNILPSAVVGHSSGEIAAAYTAGALGMKEALLVSYYRGVATSELRRPGAMGAIGLGRNDLEGLLVGNTVLACENSGSSVTISGDSDDVEASLDRVSRMRPGVLARKLKVDRAYHSSK
jgi:acyl transferase domain-containing protein